MVDTHLPPLPDDEPEVTTFVDKVSAAIAKGVTGFFRQSSEAQRVRNTGSQRVQEDQVEQLRPFGVRREQVNVILAYGESAREGVVRRQFQKLKDEIRSGRVGLVLLARHDRLSRNTPDAAELFALLVEHEVLIMVDGRVYDPSNEGDALILGVYAQFAEYENRVRSRWMAATRLAKARNLQLRIRLPAGLIWADPEDPDYRARMEAAGLSDWLRRPLGKACSEIEGRKYYILPYPDADVAAALRLLREWVFETRSLPEVERRVREGYGGWPYAGKLPAAYRAKPFPNASVEWSPVVPSGLYSFLHSPALFGRYRFEASALQKKKKQRPAVTPVPSVKPKLERRPVDVDVPEAFPSWFAPEEEQLVRRILSGSGRKPFERNSDQACVSVLHAVGTLRCAIEVAPGKRCGRKVAAYINHGKHLRYLANGCRQTRVPHWFDVSRELDEQVLEILIDVFRPDELKEIAARLRVTRTSWRDEGRALVAQLARAERERDSAEKLALDEKAEEIAAKRAYDDTPTAAFRQAWEDRRESVKRWTEKAAVAGRQIRELRERRAEQERRLKEYEDVTDEELQRCVDLAADLPGLIERVRGVPGALQRIVESLTSEVWVRPLGTGVYELTVEFASGESVVRIFLDAPRRVPQPVRVLAAGRLADGVEPGEVAAELARYPRPKGRQVLPLDTADVEGLALVHRHFETQMPRDGEHASIEELACRLSEPAESVAAVALAGGLGPARWGDKRLMVRPTEDELHRAFPEFAQHQVARVNGIDPEVIVSSSVVYQSNRRLTENKIEYVLRQSTMFRDARGRRYFLRAEIEGRGLSTRANVNEAEEARIALAAAVAALGRPELRPSDFHAAVHVVRQLGRVCGEVAYNRVQRSAVAGRIPSVRCAGLGDSGHFHPNLLFVHVPPHVLAGESPELVRAWLAGRRAVPTTCTESPSLLKESQVFDDPPHRLPRRLPR